MSEEEIRKMAVCICDNPELKGQGTPYDPRMGYYEGDTPCYTCDQKRLCSGHFGRIPLNRFYCHPSFITTVIHLLMMVCNDCGSPLLDKSICTSLGLMSKPQLQRIKLIAENSEGVKCSNRRCNQNPKYNPTNSKLTYIISCEYSNPKDKTAKINNEKSIEEVLDILSKYNSEALEIAGFVGKTRPKDFILQSIVVVPPCVRPPSHVGSTRHDHLTNSYNDIIRINNVIGKHKTGEAPISEMELKKKERDLYYFISGTFNNKNKAYSRSPRDPVISIRCRLGGKFGYVRRAAMGKTVNYCSRSVAIADNSLECGEVGICPEVENEFLKPNTVVSWNYRRVMKLYNEGKILFLTKKRGPRAGCKFQINEKSKRFAFPELGDIIETTIGDGDFILANRQPSLDRGSLSAYRAKKSKGHKCVRANGPMTTPHNLDHDGDELNLHLQRSEEARIEGKYIIYFGCNLMSNKTSTPMCGLVYNHSTAAYLLTYDNCPMPKIAFERIISVISSDYKETLLSRLTKYGKTLYHTTSLFSAILPPNFFYRKGKVVIKEGILISGLLTKSHVGTSANSIIQAMWKRYGQERTELFITEGMRVLDSYLEYRGLSLGFSDFNINNYSRYVINKLARNIQSSIDCLPQLTEDSSSTEIQMRNIRVSNILNSATGISEYVNKVMLTSSNPIRIMIDAESKGSSVNMMQLLGLLGQQNVCGDLPTLDITNGTRALQCFDPNSTNIAARGFIKTNFYDGVSESEYWFHQLGAREGIINTANGTPSTGDLHRKMTKSFEPMSIAQDYGVRNTYGHLYSLAYGDGFACSELVQVNTQIDGNIYSFIN